MRLVERVSQNTKPSRNAKQATRTGSLLLAEFVDICWTAQFRAVSGMNRTPKSAMDLSDCSQPAHHFLQSKHANCHARMALTPPSRVKMITLQQTLTLCGCS
jgi:hypothetical protein